MINVNITRYLDERPRQLQELKQKGTKVIGYLPGNYIPEELIYAGGAVPVCLISGGDRLPLQAAQSIIPGVFCPFSRAQLGEMILKRKPYYQLVDMVVCPITCQHLKKVAEIWEYRGNIEVFKLGIPHQHNNEFEIEYFTERLRVLRNRLQAYTGQEISEDRLRNAIKLYNKMKYLLSQIGSLRRVDPPPLGSREFVLLNHASYYADPAFMIKTLENIYAELKEKTHSKEIGKPRIMLIGPNIADGDYEVFNLIEEAGGTVVTEEVFEGMRDCRMMVEEEGDPIGALASAYLNNRIPPAFMRYSTGKRFNNVLKMISEYNIKGIIWYELLCCETYDVESYYFAQKLKERGIPVLVLESEYGSFNTGQTRTRIQAFIELLKGGVE